MFIDYVDVHSFYNFHGFYDHTKQNNNIIARWLADNCQSTSINGRRPTFGLIGDYDNSVVLQDLRSDIGNVLYARNHS